MTEGVVLGIFRLGILAFSWRLDVVLGSGGEKGRPRKTRKDAKRIRLLRVFCVFRGSFPKLLISGRKARPCFSRMPPAVLSEAQLYSRMVPAVLSEAELHGRMVPAVLSGAELHGRMVPAVLSEVELHGRMVPTVLPEAELCGRMLPAVPTEAQLYSRMAPSDLPAADRLCRMRPSVPIARDPSRESPAKDAKRKPCLPFSFSFAISLTSFERPESGNESKNENESFRVRNLLCLSRAHCRGVGLVG